MITTTEVSKFAATHTHTQVTSQFNHTTLRKPARIQYNYNAYSVIPYVGANRSGQVLALNLNNKFKM